MVDQDNDTTNFLFNLIWTNEHMRIILTKSTNTHHAVQRPGKFMPVNLAEFRHSDRQLSIGVKTIFVNKHMPWTIHRLERKLVSSTSVKYMFSL